MWHKTGYRKPFLLVVLVITALILTLHTLVSYKEESSLTIFTQHKPPKMIDQLSVVVALILRDSKNHLPYITNNIERLAIHFNKTSLIFIENDSTDGSPEWIKNYTRSTKPAITHVHLESFQFGGPRKDFSILARARNEVLKAILDPRYDGTDFVILLDTDLCHLWDIELMVQMNLFSDSQIN